MSTKIASQDMEPLQNFFKVFINNQFLTKIPLSSQRRYPSLQGKTAIVTGANVGLGFESSKQLLALGLSQLIMGVRSIEKGKEAAATLHKTGPAATIDVWPLDMNSYDSVQEFVQKCEKELTRIDYVILNAGLGPGNFEISTFTGHETTIQVNHLSTMLLTILLLPVLKKKSTDGSPARLTAVNSLTAHLCKFPNRNERPLLASFDNTNLVPFDPSERYGVSKLLSQLMFVMLTEHVNPDDVIINMVDPGLTKGTMLARNAKGLEALAAKVFFGIAGRTVEVGASTYVDALLGHGKESHGCFLMNQNVSPLAGIYYTEDGKTATEQIWKETIEELRFAHVDDIVKSMK